MGELEEPVRAKVYKDMSDYASKLVDKARESWEKAESYEAKGLHPEAASEREKWRDLVYAIQMVSDTISYAKKANGPNPGNPANPELLPAKAAYLEEFKRFQKEVAERAKNLGDREGELRALRTLQESEKEELGHIIHHGKRLETAIMGLAKPDLTLPEKSALGTIIGQEKDEMKKIAESLHHLHEGRGLVRREGYERHYSGGSDLAWLVGGLIALGAVTLAAQYLKGRS